MKKILFSTAMLFLLVIMPTGAQNYIKVIKSNVNVRAKASALSEVIARANEDIIFEMNGEVGDWYEIIMFSGEYRYIHKSLCERTDYNIVLPKNESLKKSLFLELLEAEDRAQSAADRLYPNDFMKNIDYSRSLNDKYKLDVLMKFKLQPPLYNKIIIEGTNNKWY